MTAAELKAALKAKGWTQVALAAHLGKNARTVRRYISGATPIPQTVAMAVSRLRVKPSPIAR